MVLMKSVDKPELEQPMKEFEGKEVTVWATQVVVRKQSGAEVKAKVFIHAPEIGHVEVADAGRVYEELLRGFVLKGGTIGKLSLVGTRKLDFYLGDTRCYEVGLDMHHDAWCIEVKKAFVLDSSFNN